MRCPASDRARAAALLHPLALYPLALLAPLAAGAAGADELRLDNGDRLTGTAVRLADGELTFATDWGGEIAVAWERVASLTTDEPVRAVLADGTELRAPAEPAEGPNGVPAIRLAPPPPAEPVVIPLAEVAALNPPEVPPVRWRGSLSAGLLASRGNSETDSRYLEAEAVARTPSDRYTAGASFKETEDGGETTSSHTAGHLRWDRFLSERWYLNSSLTLAEDEFQDLELRATLSLSSGYQLFDTERTGLSIELGASYVEEDFLLALDQEYRAARWSTDLRHRLVAEREVELFHRHEGFYGLENDTDLLVRSKSGLRFALFGKLVASLQYNLDYDQSPPPGAASTDRTYLLNLGIEW